MSLADDLVRKYARQVDLPWKSNLSPAERVWMLVYPPTEERRLRIRLAELEQATVAAGKSWRALDLTDAFGLWLAAHDYAEAFFAEPDQLTGAVLEEFEHEVSGRLADALDAPDVNESTVVAVVGAGALFPFMRASRLIESVDSHVRGRMLVLFPGRLEVATNSYRLLDARDGFNYRALAITA